MLDEGLRLCNKLYNASRLILLGAADVEPEPLVTEPVDAWMLARLDRATAELTELIDAYDFSSRGQDALPLRLERGLRLVPRGLTRAAGESEDQAEREAVSKTLLYVLDRTLRLAHPGAAPHHRGALDAVRRTTTCWPDAAGLAEAGGGAARRRRRGPPWERVRVRRAAPPAAGRDRAAAAGEARRHARRPGARAAPLQGLIEGLAHVSFASSRTGPTGSRSRPAT